MTLAKNLLGKNGNIHVVDAPSGAGKTSGAIRMMNENNGDRYIFITPFLAEVQRIKDSCTNRNFFEPKEIQTKLKGMQYLLKNKRDIASTHSLFLNFDEYTTELIREGDYTLILDEVASVVETLSVSKKDLETILEKYAHIEDGMLIWDDAEYEGKFDDIKKWAINKCVGIYSDTVLVWCFPIEIFKSFKEVYILTYLFEAQLQKYYYDFYGVKYDYLFVDRDYNYVTNKLEYDSLDDVKKKIKICNHEKLNTIGENYNALSVSWYAKDKLNQKPLINKLKSNATHYFKYITKTPSELNMWTTFKDYRGLLRGDGYARGFVSVNARATNSFGHKKSLVYCANIFVNPVLKQFFAQKGIVVNEELYALSEMLQWVFRSAIRNNEEIQVYIPSSRMRNLLASWLNNKYNNA